VACGNGDDSATPVPSLDASTTHDGSAEGSAPGDGSSDGAKIGDGGATTSSLLKHIYVVMMENHAYAQIIGDAGLAASAPNLNKFASTYGSATNYYGVTHPSLPNYLAAISGDFQGIFDDCNAGADVTCPPEEFVSNSGDGTMNQLMTASQFANASMIPHWFSGQTIVDQLEDKGLTWAAYMGALISTGDVSPGAPIDTDVDAGDDAGPDYLNLYAQKHNPFEYFQNIRTNANRMQKILPMTQLASDLAKSSAPNFVWISPDQCADMHGVHADTAGFVDAGFCTGTTAGDDMSPEVVAYGDTFVGNLVTSIMGSPTWSQGSAIVIVFDEDDYVDTTGCCNSPTGVNGGTLGGAKVPAIVISSLKTGATTSSAPYNHYSLLGTIQSLWGLGCLANTCGMTGTQLMTTLFTP
jgi:hypothetical protein